MRRTRHPRLPSTATEHPITKYHVCCIAGRVVEIGGVANSTERVVPTWSNLLCAPDALCRNHASTLATTLGSFVERARQAIDTSVEVSDFISADMFTEIAQGVDEWHQKLVAV